MDIEQLSEEEKKRAVMNAFNVAKSNTYLRVLHGDAQLFCMFMAGMRFQRTGEPEESLLDNDEFLENPEKFYYKNK